MVRQKKQNQKSNILIFFGQPLFQLLLLLTTTILSIYLLVSIFVHKTKKKVTRYKFSVPKLDIRTPHFNKLNYHHLFLSISLITFIFIFYVKVIYLLPSPYDLKRFPSKITTQIFDRSGVLLYKIYKDENRTKINVAELPDYVKNAFLAAEDKNFYKHQGYSIVGLIRAAFKNIINDSQEGGSTITQQLIKNTLLSNEKTIVRKIKELILAIEVESVYSKNEILEMYLNQVGFGGPAYGIQEASRQYFNIDANKLSISQAAYLAGITRAPSRYSPYGDNPSMAITRQKLVLKEMLQNNFISESDFSKANNETLTFESGKIEIKAPHFVMFIKDLLINQLGESTVTQGGLKIYTTLDIKIQEAAQKYVTDEISQLKKFHVSNGSALVTKPQTGEILAMVGSVDYFDIKSDGQVNLTTSLRQPGSAIKPLNYALAFENGLNPASIIDDKPLIFKTESETWLPKNYDGKFHGPVTIRNALGNSYNIPSVVILTKNGITNFASFAKKLGINTWNEPDRYGLSMALGSLEVRMTDLATAYSTFANDGVTTPLKSILKIERSNGNEIFLSSCPDQKYATPKTAIAVAEEDFCLGRKNINSTTAFFISDILSDNNARSSAFGSRSVLNIPNNKVSVKTGTSNELKDNWAIGFNKEYLVATWVGNNNNEPMSKVASGITGASPIWSHIFSKLLENSNSSPTSQPPEIVKVRICSQTGTLSCDGCPSKDEYYIKGTEPKVHCKPEDLQPQLKN